MNNEEIKEILDKLSDRKQVTLLQGLRECQLKDIEDPFITKEEYIDKILDYITNLQEENKRLKEDKRKAIEYNKKILKENWYGGYEKENATRNINILQGSDNNE